MTGYKRAGRRGIETWETGGGAASRLQGKAVEYETFVFFSYFPFLFNQEK